MSRPPRPPRTTEQATVLLERYAALAGEQAQLEAQREQALAATNATADALVLPVLEAMQQIAAIIEPWWHASAAAMTKGKRKSIELGGCIIGTKAGRAKLALAGDDFDAAATQLREQRWAKPYVRVTYAIDRVATLKGLDGAHQEKLRQAGFSKSAPAEVFVLERVTQAGTLPG